MIPSSPEYIPFGLSCGHTWDEAGAILRFLDLAGISTFIELGVHEGGLASILVSRCIFKPGFSYLGVEINPSIPREELRRAINLVPYRAAELMIGDCFEADVQQRISQTIHGSTGPVFVYCDDGNKPKEIAAYADLPRPGDYIGTHDYADGIRQLPNYPDWPHGEFPKPEVWPQDLEPLRDRFEMAYAPVFEETRTIVFRCVVGLMALAA